MLTYPADQTPPAVRALFQAADLPAGVRALAALDGYLRGEVHTDSATEPTWAVLREHIYGTLYPVGAIAPALPKLIAHHAARGETLLGLWPADALPADLPTPAYTGEVLDFTDRAGSLAPFLATLPADCTLHRMDADLLMRSANYKDLIRTHGSIEAAATKEFAFCLLHHGELAAEASAASLSDTLMEVGMVTHEDYQRRGYATYLCAHLIDQCEQLGCSTYWNCNSENSPSTIIARKLGYQTERPYRLHAWWPAG